MNCTISALQFDALQSFYTSLNGTAWSIVTPWNFSSPLSAPCSVPWTGITCAYVGSSGSTACDITSLDLESSNLHGPFPSSMTQLSGLLGMNLTNNMISGSVPSAWVSFPNLQYLHLAQNRLEGTLPAMLSPSLSVLDVSKNRLRGSLPSSWSGMSSMVTLNLNDNRLTGSLPAEWTKMSKMSVLSINSNLIDGTFPPSWMNFTSMTELSLTSMFLVGDLPDDFSRFSNLTYLELNNESFSSTLPKSLSLVSTLTSLRLGYNDFIGDIPSGWSTLTRLETLSLWSNYLIGQVPTAWSTLTKLNELYLGGNSLTGTMPEFISGFTNLVELQMGSNSFTGVLPVRYSVLTNLKLFTGGLNMLHGRLPTAWSSLSSMNKLSLVSNKLSGRLPEVWSKWTSLEYLDIGSNRLTGEFPSNYSALVGLSYLTLDANRINGTIPASWSKLSRLLVFNVATNSLTGSLPTGFHQWKLLQQFNVSTNKLKGPLPVEYSSMTLLQGAGFMTNYFTGTLPTQWNTMSLLEIVAVASNHMHGTLPSQWSTMTSLIVINVQFNSFTGTLPTSWGAFNQLQAIFISNKLLYGTLPNEYSNMTSMQTFYIYQGKFTGTLPALWSTWSNLLYIRVERTLATGTLPKEWSTWSNLSYAYLCRNSFSGTVPLEWSSWNQLQHIQLYVNSLSGHLPDYFGEFLNLRELSLDYNFFHGTIFISSSLTFLRIDSNYFTGQVNGWNLPYVTYVNASNNFFTGSLAIAGDRTNPQLQLMDVSFNKLTGPIDFHRLPLAQNVYGLVLSDNCFTGTVSSDLCSYSNLTILIMDNLSSRAKCGLYKLGIQVKKKVTGSIPSCLYSMPDLQVIRFIGNGLSGTLADVNAQTSLQTVAIMNNYISGAIPDSWQSYGGWQQLLLSFNKITGLLNSDFAVPDATYVNMSSNRLSGAIPSDFRHLSSMDVIEGNIFSCSSNYGNDVHSSNYSCGSLALSLVGIVYAVIVFLAAAILIGNSTVLLPRFRMILDVSFPTQLLRRIVYLSFLMVMAFVFSQTLSSIQSYAMFTHEYGWSTTLTFLRGVVPMIGFVPVISLMLLLMYDSVESPYYVNPNWIKIKSLEINWNQMFDSRRVLGQLVNLSIIALVTFVYIYIILNSAEPTAQLVISILLAMFKVTWNSIFVSTALIESAARDGARIFIILTHSLLADIIGLIICPICVIVTTNAQCMKYAILSLPSVSTSYICQSTYTNIDVQINSFQISKTAREILRPSLSYIARNLASPTVVVSQVQPEWYYSFMCSSGIIRSYVSVVFYSYLIFAVILPVIKVVILFQDDETRHRWMKYRLATVLLDIKRPYESYDNVDVFRKMLADVQLRNTCQIHRRRLRNILFLMIFGISAPLLGGVIVFTMFVDELLTRSQLEIFRRDLSRHVEESSVVEGLVESTIDKDIPNIYYMYLPFCILIGLLYWTLYMYDIIADVYPAPSGSVAAAVFFCVCLVTFASAQMFWMRRYSSQLSRARKVLSLELSPVHVQ